MVIALAISGVLTMAFSIAILFGIGDITLALRSPTKYAIIQIFLTATGSKGAATAMVSALISTLIFATFGTLACASRLAWAFARDKGFPFPDYFAHVSKKTSPWTTLCKPRILGTEVSFRSADTTRSQSEPLSLSLSLPPSLDWSTLAPQLPSTP